MEALAAILAALDVSLGQFFRLFKEGRETDDSEAAGLGVPSLLQLIRPRLMRGG